MVIVLKKASKLVATEVRHDEPITTIITKKQSEHHLQIAIYYLFNLHIDTFIIKVHKY